MRHLTPEEIERFAGGDWPLGETSARGDTGVQSRHVAECAECREEVESVRALTRCLMDLPEASPSRSLADSVMASVELPIPWLDAALGSLPQFSPSVGFAGTVVDHADLPMPWLEAAFRQLPELAPSAGFAVAVMGDLDLPVPWLDRALAALPAARPAPGFATSVMSRVRLPIPWRQRVGRFAHRRRVALAGAAASTVAASGVGAMWLFGVQGVTPVQFITFVLGGVRQFAVDGLVALGGIGYELGLVDAGSSITQITPGAALSGLALATAVGLLSLFVMARLMRTGPELRFNENA